LIKGFKNKKLKGVIKMVERFQRYIDKKFHLYPKSKALEELKEELLGTLIDRYEEYRAEGLTEEESYNKAIASIGEYGATVRELEGSVGRRVKGWRAGMALSLSFLYWMVVVTTFLVVSVITTKWHPTWLIIVAGAFIYLTLLLIMTYNKEKSLEKNRNVRAMVLIFFILISLALFIVPSIIIGYWHLNVLTLLLGIFAWLTYDSVVYTKANNRIAFKIRMYFIISVWTVWLYLAVSFISAFIAGYSGVWTWSWLIFMAGTLVLLSYNFSLVSGKYKDEVTKTETKK